MAVGKETIGLLLAATSSLFFSIEILLAKVTGMSPIVVTWYGSLGMVLLSTPFMWSRKHWNLTPKTMQLIALRSFAASLCHVGAFAAIELLPLGDASVLLYVSPVFTIILARIFLNEPCNLFSAVMILAVMTGIILFTQPTLIFLTSAVSLNYIKGATVALLSSFADAIGNVVLRELKSLHYSVLLCSQGLLSFTFTSVLIPFTTIFRTENVNHICRISMALFAAVEQYLLITAFSLARAGPVATCQVMDVIFAFIFQVAFFGEQISFVSFLGAAIVIGAVILMSLKSEEELFVESEVKETVPVQYVC